MAEEPQDSVTVTLKYPVARKDDDDIQQIVIRRPKVRDLRLATQKADGDFDTMRHLLARCTGLIPPEVDQMDLADFARATVALEAMMPAEFLANLSPQKPDDGEGGEGKAKAGAASSD